MSQSLLRHPIAGDLLLYGIGAGPSPDDVRGGWGRPIYGCVVAVPTSRMSVWP